MVTSNLDNIRDDRIEFNNRIVHCLIQQISDQFSSPYLSQKFLDGFYTHIE